MLFATVLVAGRRAGVEVDGQPSGAYPRVRLPLQLRLISWALGSTRPPTPPPDGTGPAVVIPTGASGTTGGR